MNRRAQPSGSWLAQTTLYGWRACQRPISSSTPGTSKAALSASTSARPNCTIAVATNTGLWSSAGTRMWRCAEKDWRCPDARMTFSMSLRNWSRSASGTGSVNETIIVC
ncbi:hypothetical protein RVR_10537 [Actinacidiphila reveromycinica]|uniref:Uncharacterized protein n=1 Tax=Actinacidiphila reveromycinica TaxID=659352 RepID=A0A7U3UYM0_9ACTN|nr:hypothetical protein RVR_10537 [Streptomyces sp. SN-593]